MSNQQLTTLSTKIHPSQIGGLVCPSDMSKHVK
jgi:hypothetical protein